MKDTVLKDNKMYVVTMYRYGNYYGHSYLLCVTDNYNLAAKYEDDERYYSGNKYYGEISTWELNSPKKLEIIRSLDNHPMLQL